MAPTLGYWSIRGIAEPIRYLLHYTGTEYVDKQYQIGPDLATYKDAFRNEKDKLGLEFPNVPYYIDGDLHITESRAILGHLGRKHGLAGACEEDFYKLDVADGVLTDMGFHFVRLCYAPQFEMMKEAFIAEVPAKMEKMSKLIWDGDYILGDKICFLDFLLFENLERYTALVPDCLAKFPNLGSFHARVAALPAIAKYRESPGYQKIKTRYNNRTAFFGNGLESYQ